MYMNIVYIAQWLFGGNSEILHCSDVSARRQKLCKPQNILCKHVSTFLPRNYDVISQ